MVEERERMPIHGVDPAEVAGGGRSGRGGRRRHRGRETTNRCEMGKSEEQELPPHPRPVMWEKHKSGSSARWSRNFRSRKETPTDRIVSQEPGAGQRSLAESSGWNDRNFR
jgi:hypothetical protein